MNEKLLNKAATYCSKAEHCESEVKEKLRQWEASDVETEEIVEYLIRERYIDNARYASSYVRDKFRFNHWGRIKISLMLRSKQIDDCDIQSALEEIDDGVYMERLSDILKDKLRSLKYESDYEKRGKLFKFAQSRGFESQVISKIIDSI